MNGDYMEGLIRRTANRLGIDIHRHRPEELASGRLSAMLATHAINLVLDVGANSGQFAKSLRNAGYLGQIVSIEPLSIAHAELLNASRHDARWEIAPRAAIGDFEGEIDINVAANSFSSSALRMLDSHKNAAPGSAYIGRERVRLVRLDTLARNYVESGSSLFVKIDTQGYEDRVIAGASNMLDKVRGLQLELSFVPLYEAQLLFDELVARLRALGFSIWAFWPGICDPQSGRMLQVDATFFRD